MKIDKKKSKCIFLSERSHPVSHSRYMVDNLSDRIDIHDKTKLWT